MRLENSRSPRLQLFTTETQNGVLCSPYLQRKVELLKGGGDVMCEGPSCNDMGGRDLNQLEFMERPLNEAEEESCSEQYRSL